jgi:hypothetical protein
VEEVSIKYKEGFKAQNSKKDTNHDVGNQLTSLRRVGGKPRCKESKNITHKESWWPRSVKTNLG